MPERAPVAVTGIGTLGAGEDRASGGDSGAAVRAESSATICHRHEIVRLDGDWCHHDNETGDDRFNRPIPGARYSRPAAGRQGTREPARAVTRFRPVSAAQAPARTSAQVGERKGAVLGRVTFESRSVIIECPPSVRRRTTSPVPKHGYERLGLRLSLGWEEP